MHIISSVLVIQDLAIARHQNRNRVGQQEHARCDGTGGTIKALMSDPCIFQFNRIHQVMKSDMCITSTEPGKQRSHQTAESNERIPTKRTEEQIEPNHVGLEASYRTNQSEDGRRIVK